MLVNEQASTLRGPCDFHVRICILPNFIGCFFQFLACSGCAGALELAATSLNEGITSPRGFATLDIKKKLLKIATLGAQSLQ
jgi:hypothetical protein